MGVTLTYNDYYEIQLGSIITDYDRKILTRLYQPIVGHQAIALYFTLWSELDADQTMTTTKKKHTRLFDMMNCGSNEFVKYRMYLEAVGLVKSFINEGEEDNKYVYRIFAPLTPKEFFEHALLCPLLKRSFTDENEFIRTKTQFLKSSGVKTTYKDISAQFTDVFKNLNRLELVNVEDRYIGKVSLKVQTTFDFDAFYIGLKDYQIPKKIFTREVVDEISLLSEAYSIDAIEMRYIVMNSIELIDGERQINFQKMREQASNYATKTEKQETKKKEQKVVSISGNSNAKTLIEQYNTIPTVKFFKLRNNNMELLPSDISLIKDLKNAGLNDPVINVILDYCLAKNENILVPNYVKKVAQTIIRNKIDSAYQAMVFLENPRSYNKPSTTKKVEDLPKIKVDTSSVKVEDDESDKWW